jgi:hypothetical protein
VLAFLLALVAAAPATEVGVVFHVARTPSGEAVLSHHGAEQLLTRASELHAASQVRFSLARLEPLPEGVAADVHTVADRNGLARALGRPDGLIHVFAMGAVDDKDKPGGKLAGVHWRRGDRHYVILSTPDSVPETLGHELGHLFGLGHEKDPANLMTPAPSRTDVKLTARQSEAVARRLADYRRSGELK